MAADTKTILIVDDEADILEFLGYNLRKEGFVVYTVSNGRDALQKADEVKPQLIILDIMMPELDGIEVCRRLRATDAHKHTLIVFLTAKSEDFSQVDGFESGADDYITKPIRPRVFISRIHALLRRQNLSQPVNQIHFNELTIDKENFAVLKNGEDVGLARKEFELFYLLSTKPGRVFTREEIFSKVWGTDVVVGHRTIDVHIRKVREKIGDNCIKTLKGIGYKFEF